MIGRPSKYEPSYCDAVIELMGEGLSLTTFAARVGAHRSTVIDWGKAHPEFAAALDRARAKRCAWLERQLLKERANPARLNAIRLGLYNAAPGEWRRQWGR